ncbi:hypothetical protein [Neobacillus sp. CF12]|uniref:hypothetical protein n=1 Tax=Neobacillus sp. CF12 TaxID=3055864 RepID=UPI0025A27271|nr:hypothetical protein [Neobacillus sp. CF12]MDM5331196.1 hypothetical protein [Neobacillus sp. CF12]
MLRIIWRLLLILLCVYLFIEWFPITFPIVFEDILVGPIIYPLEFFAASIAFFFGLVMLVQLLHEVLHFMNKIVMKRRRKR